MYNYLRYRVIKLIQEFSFLFFIFSSIDVLDAKEKSATDMSMEMFKKEMVKIFGSGELTGKPPSSQLPGLLYPRESETREVNKDKRQSKQKHVMNVLKHLLR